MNWLILALELPQEVYFLKMRKSNPRRSHLENNEEGNSVPSYHISSIAFPPSSALPHPRILELLEWISQTYNFLTIPINPAFNHLIESDVSSRGHKNKAIAQQRKLKWKKKGALSSITRGKGKTLDQIMWRPRQETSC